MCVEVMLTDQTGQIGQMVGMKKRMASRMTPGFFTKETTEEKSVADGKLENCGV